MILFVDGNIGILFLRVVLPIDPSIEPSIDIVPPVTLEVVGEVFERVSRSTVEFKKMTKAMEEFSDNSKVLIEIDGSSLIVSIINDLSSIETEYGRHSISIDEFKRISKVL